MGVVVSAEQGEVVKISKPAVDPIHYVVSIAVVGGMSTSGEAASAVSYVQCHGLAWGGESSGSAQGEGNIVVVDDGGPDFSLLSNPQQLIRGQRRAVAGFSQPGFGEQVLQADGDDH